MTELGIMGGTFNPIHNGHLEIARQAMQGFGLDRVLFLPSGTPPHKHGSSLLDREHRFKMVELAVAGQPGFEASDLEVRRPGVTYTVDTLTQLTNLYPNCALYYIVGSDTLFDLHTWREVDRALELCSLVAVPRPGCRRENLVRQALRLRERFGVMVYLMDEWGPDISSTQIRARVALGEPLEGLVPPAVAEYIEKQHLYGRERP